MTRLSLITLVIISTLILIITGYDNDQIAPAIGLLGTIADYLLGRSPATEPPAGVEPQKTENKKQIGE